MRDDTVLSAEATAVALTYATGGKATCGEVKATVSRAALAARSALTGEARRGLFLEAIGLVLDEEPVTLLGIAEFLAERQEAYMREESECPHAELDLLQCTDGERVWRCEECGEVLHADREGE